MCNITVKAQNIINFQNLKIEQIFNNFTILCCNCIIAHLCYTLFLFDEYLASPPTMTETCRRFNTRCIPLYLNISAVVGMCVYIYT